MDQENKLPSEAILPETIEEISSEMAEEMVSEPVLLPDDALADNNIEDNIEIKNEEMFPTSLDEEEDLFEEDDGLFTDEELAAFSKKDSTSDLTPKKTLEADLEDESVPDVLPEGSTSKKVMTTDRVRGAFDIVEMFVFAMAFVLMAMAFCFRHSVVDGSSMDNTLHDGEHLIISDVFYTPKKGDIVVVQDLSKEALHPELSHPIVKRVIATEGQTVMISPRGEIYVDGELLEEDYIYIDDPYYVYDPLFLTVPEDSVFLMGDHRNVSLDSRSSAGSFSEDAILGKVILRFSPLNRFGIVK